MTMVVKIIMCTGVIAAVVLGLLMRMDGASPSSPIRGDDLRTPSTPVRGDDPTPRAPSLRDDASSQTPKLYPPCSSDSQCPKGKYCRTQSTSPICVECTDCVGVFKRFERFACARGHRECGDCLPGYTEVPSSVRELRCMETKDLNPST